MGGQRRLGTVTPLEEVLLQREPKWDRHGPRGAAEWENGEAMLEVCGERKYRERCLGRGSVMWLLAV